jgi:HD superfamily phosphohydrolase
MNRTLLGRPRIFRDPIHGDITYPKGEFQELVESILDSPVFQRLRYIRQNGVLNLVFHGAEHSRFSHVMGAAWVAGRMFDAVYRNTDDPSLCVNREQERNDTVLAALLHDVGHGPFSHTLEEILRSISVEFDHEEMTKRILTERESQIAKLLKKYDKDVNKRLIPFIDKDKRKPNKWFYSIVSSELDADRLDYLLRDATMAGVLTHRLDLNRLIDALGVHQNKIVVDGRARDIIESYLLALEQMYASVYFHHTNRAASFLLRAIIWRAAELGRKSKKACAELFPLRIRGDDPLWRTISDGQRVPLPIYETLDENHVWALISLWSTSKDPTLSELSSAIKARRFPKVIPIRKEEVSPNALNQLGEQARDLLKAKHPDRDPKYYIHVDRPARKAYPGGVWEDNYAGSIKLLYPDGRCEPAESNERSIARLIKDKAIYPSLIVPEEIRDEAADLLERLKT